MGNRSKRRWLQFRLRTLFLFFVIVAGGLSWVASMRSVTIPQTEALKQLKEFKPVAVWNPAKWWRPAHVDFLSFSKSRRKPSDNDLVHLKALTHLKFLDLSGARITDEGLVHVSSLNRLTRLELKGTDVTDEGLVRLGSMSHLEYVGLQNTKISQQGALKLMRSLPEATIFYAGGGERRNWELGSERQ